MDYTDPTTGEKPDGWIIEHARATDRLIFGPFTDLDEARAFCLENPLVACYPKPIYKTVNWNRRG